jgi:hypothetical protein
MPWRKQCMAVARGVFDHQESNPLAAAFAPTFAGKVASLSPGPAQRPIGPVVHFLWRCSVFHAFSLELPGRDGYETFGPIVS